MRQIELATCLFVLGVQTVLWGRTASSLDARGHAHQAAQVALQAGCLALALCLSTEAWRRYRRGMHCGWRDDVHRPQDAHAARCACPMA